MQMIQTTPQNTQVVVQQHVKPVDTGTNPRYYGIVSIILGVIQIVIGLIMLGLQLGLTSKQIALHHIGSGYWCGIFVVIIGALGIAAGVTKRKAVIVAFMACSIVCTVLVWCVIIANLISAGVATANNEDSSYDFAMAALAGIEFIVAVTSSGFGCGGICCCTGPSQQVIYQQGGQSIIVQGPGGMHYIPQQQGNIQGYTTQNVQTYTTQNIQGYSPQVQQVQIPPQGGVAVHQGYTQPSVPPYNEPQDYQGLVRSKPLPTAPPPEGQEQPPPYLSIYDKDSNEGYLYPDQTRVNSGPYEQAYVPPDPSSVYEEIGH